MLLTDASGYALGAILSQQIENEEFVCAYASRTLNTHEIHYSISEKECLAVIFGIKTFRVYLQGTKFKVITDHSALSWLMTIKDPNGRLARWVIYLQSYEFEIIHRKGNIHSNVDALSRPVVNLIELRDRSEEHFSPKYLDPYKDKALMHFLKFDRHMPGASNKQVKRLEKLSSKLLWSEDKLLYRVRFLR